MNQWSNSSEVTFQETVEVYHFEPVDPELLRKVSQRSLEDLTINQRVAEMARNHEKIVAQMSACYNFVCSMMIGPRFGNFGTIQWRSVKGSLWGQNSDLRRCDKFITCADQSAGGYPRWHRFICVRHSLAEECAIFHVALTVGDTHRKTHQPPMFQWHHHPTESLSTARAMSRGCFWYVMSWSLWAFLHVNCALYIGVPQANGAAISATLRSPPESQRLFSTFATSHEASGTRTSAGWG